MSKNKQGIKVLIAGSVLQLFLGIIYVWSVFVKPISDAYSWNIDNVKLMSSFMLCFFVVGILIGGKLQPKIGSNITVLGGGLMLSIGMLASSFITANTTWLMYFTYGILGGFGVGAAYNSIISSAQKWFPKNRGLATGVSVCAFGFSTVIFAPLIEQLIAKFEVVNTFRLLAAAFFVIVIAFFSFIKTPDDAAATGASADLLKKQQYTMTQALKTKEFYLITASMLLLTATFFILNPSLKSIAEDKGIAASTVIVMVTGIASAIGRLVVPVISDKIGRENTAFSIIAATAVCAVSLCFVSGYLFALPIAVIAFCYGGSSGIYPVITADYFGIKNVGSNYGAVMVGFALSALLFPIFMKNIVDTNTKFIVLASFAALGAVSMLILKLAKKKRVEV